MDNPCDLVVTLELGTKRRVITAREIVHEARDPGLAGRLIALLLTGSPPGKRRGEGGGEGQIAENVTQNAFQEISETRLRSGSREGAGGARVTEPPAHDPNDPERVAAHLASALRDEKSIAFFRIVARAVPREVIRDALTRALDAQNIRKSRSALFVHIVRSHLPHRSLTNHRTP
jgi:hypothetical protein